MKILHVNTLCEGGAATACINLHKGLLQEGIDSMFLSLNETNSNIPECDSLRSYYKGLDRFIFEQKNIFYKSHINFVFRNYPIVQEPLMSPNSFFDITDHPFYHKADVINLHWVGGFLDYTSFFKRNKKPVVWTLHDMSPFSPGYPYEKNFPKATFKKLESKFIKTKIASLREKNITVISPSRWLMNKSLQSKVFKNFTHLNIPYGIDTNLFKIYDRNVAREILGLPKEKNILLFVSDIVENKRKGLHLLFESIKSIKNSDNLILCTIGKKQNNMDVKGQLNIIELGSFKDPILMALAYSAADLFLIPSVEDNLPNTVLESLACGTPVIGFKVGGVPEMIEHKINGLLCPTIDSLNLAKSIKRFLNKDYLFDKDFVSNKAKKEYDLSIQARAYIEVYSNLLNNN
ncbi:MAG: glycosyltransferase [Leptolyngbya sp. SIO3F4]|nr:glycosyltransferase [Leptolyngbya sp. SIO3F4]